MRSSVGAFKFALSVAAAVWTIAVASAQTARIDATADVTLHFSTGGSDATGDGSVGNPFREANACIALFQNGYDMRGFVPTCQADVAGTYDAVKCVGQVPGSYFIWLKGDTAALGTVIQPSSTGTQTSDIYTRDLCFLLVDGFYLQRATVGGVLDPGSLAEATQKSLLELFCIAYGPTTGFAHISAHDQGARVNTRKSSTTCNSSINGSALAHVEAWLGGTVDLAGGSVYVPSTGAYSSRAFLLGYDGGSAINWDGETYNGSGSGSGTPSTYKDAAYYGAQIQNFDGLASVPGALGWYSCVLPSYCY